jgi:hypothetical protein
VIGKNGHPADRTKNPDASVAARDLPPRSTRAAGALFAWRKFQIFFPIILHATTMSAIVADFVSR